MTKKAAAKGRVMAERGGSRDGNDLQEYRESFLSRMFPAEGLMEHYKGHLLVKKVKDHLKSEIDAMLSYPEMYGTLESTEMQFLQALEIMGLILDPESGPRHVRHFWQEKITESFPLPSPVASQVENDVKRWKLFMSDFYSELCLSWNQKGSRKGDSKDS